MRLGIKEAEKVTLKYLFSSPLSVFSSLSIFFCQLISGRLCLSATWLCAFSSSVSRNPNQQRMDPGRTMTKMMMLVGVGREESIVLYFRICY